jgi:hypothetical protein
MAGTAVFVPQTPTETETAEHDSVVTVYDSHAAAGGRPGTRKVRFRHEAGVHHRRGLLDRGRGRRVLQRPRSHESVGQDRRVLGRAVGHAFRLGVIRDARRRSTVRGRTARGLNRWSTARVRNWKRAGLSYRMRRITMERHRTIARNAGRLFLDQVVPKSAAVNDVLSSQGSRVLGSYC